MVGAVRWESLSSDAKLSAELGVTRGKGRKGVFLELVKSIFIAVGEESGLERLFAPLKVLRTGRLNHQC